MTSIDTAMEVGYNPTDTMRSASGEAVSTTLVGVPSLTTSGEVMDLASLSQGYHELKNLIDLRTERSAADFASSMTD